MVYCRLIRPEFLQRQQAEWERIMSPVAGPIVESSPRFKGVFIRDKQILANELAQGPFRYRLFYEGTLSPDTRECGTKDVLKYLEESIDLKCAVVVGEREAANGQR